VAAALEALSVRRADPSSGSFEHTTRSGAARACYDHVAGTLGVSPLDRFIALGWLSAPGPQSKIANSARMDAVRTARYRYRSDSRAPPPFRVWVSGLERAAAHLGGALGAAVLQVALKKRWVAQDLDSRVLSVTRIGRRDMHTLFDLTIDPSITKAENR
jgi:hypothetical protein